MQAHFLDNAKLSENYFIVNCEQLLVCLSINSCLAIELWLFHINDVFLFISNQLSIISLFYYYLLGFLLFGGCCLYMLVPGTRKWLLLLMSFPLDYMRNTFSVSGTFLSFQEITKYQNTIYVSRTILWIENLLEWKN